MKKSEFFAASQFLTDWPDDMYFWEILEGIENGHPDIVRWDMVESWDADDLALAVEMCEAAFSRAVADILNEEKNPQPSEALNAQMGDPVQFLKDHFQIINVKG